MPSKVKIFFNPKDFYESIDQDDYVSTITFQIGVIVCLILGSGSRIMTNSIKIEISLLGSLGFERISDSIRLNIF